MNLTIKVIRIIIILMGCGVPTRCFNPTLASEAARAAPEQRMRVQPANASVLMERKGAQFRRASLLMKTSASHHPISVFIWMVNVTRIVCAPRAGATTAAATAVAAVAVGVVSVFIVSVGLSKNAVAIVTD